MDLYLLGRAFSKSWVYAWAHRLFQKYLKVMNSTRGRKPPRGFAPGNVLMAFIRSGVFPAHSRAGSWLHQTPRGWWELLASISHRLQSQAVQPRSSELVEAGMGSAPGHSRVVTPSATKGPGLGPAWGFFSIPGVI